MTATDDTKQDQASPVQESAGPRSLGITGGTLTVACFFCVVLSIAGSWFTQKFAAEPETTQPYKIAVLDTKKVLDAELKALMANVSLQRDIDTENKRFSKELMSLIEQKANEGYIIIHKEALVTGDAQTVDLTNLFLNQLVPKPGATRP